jgi:iron complex outermembrane receptor protein
MQADTGLRYIWDEQKNKAQHISYRFTAAPGTFERRCTDPALEASNCRLMLKQKSDKPTWLIELGYKPIDDGPLRGKYARGYRALGVHERLDQLPQIRSGKGRPLRDRLEVHVPGRNGTFHVAAFYNDFTNQQLQFGFDARAIDLFGKDYGTLPSARSREMQAPVDR